MRRRALTGVALAVLAAVAAWLGGPVAEGAEGPPARVLITADEFTLTLSRAAIRRGDTILQHYNRGEDPHDLRLRRVGSTRVRSIPVTGPGEAESIRLRMGRGRWRLWCSLSDHRELGMKATLRVKRRR